MRKNQTESRRGTRAEGMRGGETLRKRVFILLKGEKILDTNYSYADATRSLMRSVCLEDREDWNIEEEHQARQE